MFHFPFRQLLERYFFFPPNFQQLKYEKKMKKSFAFSLLSLRYPYSPVYVLGLDKSIF